MGRKKIQIRFIKNERLRNITYNKRKKGLLKKIVELNKLCGIKAKLQLIDIFGNLITLDAGQEEINNLKNQISQEKSFIFSSDDYPDFKGLQKLKKKKQGDFIDQDEQSITSVKLENLLKLQDNAQIAGNLNNFVSKEKLIQPNENEMITKNQFFQPNLIDPQMIQLFQYFQACKWSKNFQEYLEMIHLNTKPLEK